MNFKSRLRLPNHFTLNSLWECQLLVRSVLSPARSFLIQAVALDPILWGNSLTLTSNIPSSLKHLLVAEHTVPPLGRTWLGNRALTVTWHHHHRVPASLPRASACAEPGRDPCDRYSVQLTRHPKAWSKSIQGLCVVLEKLNTHIVD